ncbi:NADH-quinone oxidoreductase subunit C [Streptomyces sp. NPDC059008]|uniref:NADH-quinone oxidoreductase subunit C n=1 Tax=Streptomyces sp. NPDC059008 TaxID=3346693 RepID=UPI0036AC32D8
MSEQPDQPEQPAEQPAEQPEAAEQPATEPEPVVGWLPRPASEIFGAGATAELAYDLLTVDVPSDGWLAALTAARDDLGCSYFDWLSAVDEPGTGFRICAHLADVAHPGTVRRLIVRTTVPHGAAALPTAVGVYAGAGWHERETHEMFGVDFTGHPHLVPLLLPESFEGHPLRKDFVLAARVAKAWPGAKEPGESEHGGPKRRQMLPPGVPDPNEWGPLKGQLPPAPARPARGTRAAGGARAAGAAAGERPVRRARTASAGSASQQAAGEGAATPKTPEAAETPAAPAPTGRPERPARRTRSAGEGSASQQRAAAEAAGPEQAPAAKAPEEPAAPRSSDAPWHHARPAFDEPERKAAPEQPEQKAAPEETAPQSPVEPQQQPEPVEKPEPAPESAPESAPEPTGEAEQRAEPVQQPEPRPDQATPQDPAGGDTP